MAKGSDRYNDKVEYEKFVELIAAEKSIRSKAILTK